MLPLTFYSLLDYSSLKHAKSKSVCNFLLFIRLFLEFIDFMNFKDVDDYLVLFLLFIRLFLELIYVMRVEKNVGDSFLLFIRLFH